MRPECSANVDALTEFFTFVLDCRRDSRQKRMDVTLATKKKTLEKSISFTVTQFATTVVIMEITSPVQ